MSSRGSLRGSLALRTPTMMRSANCLQTGLLLPPAPPLNSAVLTSASSSSALLSVRLGTSQGVDADLIFSSANDLFVFHSEEMSISPEMATLSSLSKEVRVGTGGTAASSPQGVDADLVFSSANDLLVFHSEEMSISPEMASLSSLSEEVRVGAGGTAASDPQDFAADSVFFS